MEGNRKTRTVLKVLGRTKGCKKQKKDLNTTPAAQIPALGGLDPGAGGQIPAQGCQIPAQGGQIPARTVVKEKLQSKE